MTECLHSSPVSGACLVSVAGEWVELAAGGAAEMRKLAAAGEPVQLRDVVTFRAGWNRKGLGLSDKALRQFASTCKATPRCLEHDPALVTGVILGGRVDKTDGVRLLQDMEVNTPLGLSMLSTGIIPRYSIAWDRDEETELLCSLHKAPWEQCDCWPGMTKDDNGQTMQLLYTTAVAVETSQTSRPAVPGTGGTLSADGQLFALLHDRWARRDSAARIYTPTRKTMEIETTPELAAPPVEVPAPVPVPELAAPPVVDLSGELAARDEEIATLRASLEMERAAKLTAEGQRWVRDHRAAGRLVGDEEAILSVYRQAPEAVQALAAFLPVSPIRAGSQVVTGSGAAPEVPATGGASLAMSVYKRVQDRLKADPSLSATDVWREESTRANR